MKLAAIKTIGETRRIAETTSIAADVTMAARRATYTTARERRRSPSKGTGTKCEAGVAGATSERIPVSARSAAMTVAVKREAMSREARPALAEAASAGGEAASVAVVGVAAEADADSDVLRVFQQHRECPTRRKYMRLMKI